MTSIEEALRNFADPNNLRQYARMMRETNECMARHDKNGFDTDKCENAIISPLDYYTFHTHPHGKTTPSGVDIETTKRLGKKLLCIGLAPTGKIVCYDTEGKTILGSYSVGL